MKNSRTYYVNNDQNVNLINNKMLSQAKHLRGEKSPRLWSSSRFTKNIEASYLDNK